MPKYFISKDGQRHSWSYDLALGTMVHSGVSGSIAKESMKIAEKLLNEHEISTVYSTKWVLLSEEIRRGNISLASTLVESMKSGPIVDTVPRNSSKLEYFQYVLGMVRAIDLVRIIGSKGSDIERKLDRNNKDHDQWLLDLLSADLGINNSDISDLCASTDYSLSGEGTLLGDAKNTLIKMTDKWRTSFLENSLKLMGIDLADLLNTTIGTSVSTIDSATKTLLLLGINPFSKEEAISTLNQHSSAGGDPRIGYSKEQANSDQNPYQEEVWEMVKTTLGIIWAAVGGASDSNDSDAAVGSRGKPRPDGPVETGKLWKNFIALARLWRFNPNKIGQPMPYSENTNSHSTYSRTISRSSRIDRAINWGPDGGGLSSDSTDPPPDCDPGGRIPTPDPIRD